MLSVQKMGFPAHSDTVAATKIPILEYSSALKGQCRNFQPGRSNEPDHLNQLAKDMRQLH